MVLREQLKTLGVDVDVTQEQQLVAYLDEMLRWNRSINLTAIVDRDEALEKHLVDSLTVLPLLTGEERLLDMGSGAGLPGIPLKIMQEKLRILSIDSVAKKISFQKHISRLLGLRQFEARHGRLEVLARDSALRETFDVVVARAFASLTDCARHARPFLASGGRLIAMKGPDGGDELRHAVTELESLDLVCSKQVELRLPVSGAERLILVLDRVSTVTSRESR